MRKVIDLQKANEAEQMVIEELRKWAMRHYLAGLQIERNRRLKRFLVRKPILKVTVKKNSMAYLFWRNRN